MRIAGIDLGARRIGVAVSDAGATLASPHSVILRSGDIEQDHAAIAAVVADTDAARVVVGLPLSLDGSRGPAARAVEAEVAELATRVPVPVEMYDERFTTVTATRSLQERKIRGRARRDVVDQVAAAVMLQAWLDTHTR